MSEIPLLGGDVNPIIRVGSIGEANGCESSAMDMA
jgi:hypothetical protein